MSDVGFAEVANYANTSAASATGVVGLQIVGANVAGGGVVAIASPPGSLLVDGSGLLVDGNPIIFS